MSEEIYHHLCSLEKQIHSPKVRTDLDKLKELLHDEFKEIGRSGKVYNKSDVLNQLADQKKSPEIISEEFHFKSLSDLIFLVTYRSYQQVNEKKSHWAMRSSVWIFEQDKWQMVFHQGTPF
ncbi:MAG: nuclear transport factor 2 family protein [Proteobacteria bacterium]|nr:nuclear transport factor 2 family protein [Pseudomonadota bacterium]